MEIRQFVLASKEFISLEDLRLFMLAYRVDIGVSSHGSINDPSFEYRYVVTMLPDSLIDPVCEAIKDLEGAIQLLKLM
ncbi:hypothetical protein [Burkholderia phage BCSR52]|uniref:Uncharacterized protein n=1 Tax=Burkholderia phage BCSR52 TaxID=2805748 RepID=A0A889IQP9_9CAUD|nr:hypothetical protein [Burkholderia phage BCSR52]